MPDCNDNVSQVQLEINSCSMLLQCWANAYTSAQHCPIIGTMSLSAYQVHRLWMVYSKMFCSHRCRRLSDPHSSPLHCTAHLNTRQFLKRNRSSELVNHGWIESNILQRQRAVTAYTRNISYGCLPLFDTTSLDDWLVAELIPINIFHTELQ